MIETQLSQIAQQVGSQGSNQGKQFSGQTVVNPIEHVKAVFVNSGNHEEYVAMVEVVEEVVCKVAPYNAEDDFENELYDALPHSEEGSASETESVKREEAPLRVYKPSVPFPQRLREHERRVFLAEQKKNITTPVPVEVVEFHEIQPPTKQEDPGSFSIPVKIGHLEVENALCDLGASVSVIPLSIARKMGLGELEPPQVTLQMADLSAKPALGELNNVEVRISRVCAPCDFMVVEEMDELRSPIILGRPFLKTAGAIFNLKEGSLSFNVGDEKVSFSFPDSEILSLRTKGCLMSNPEPPKRGCMDSKVHLRTEKGPKDAKRRAKKRRVPFDQAPTPHSKDPNALLGDGLSSMAIFNGPSSSYFIRVQPRTEFDATSPVD